MSELIDRETTVKQICKIGEMLGVGHDRDVAIAVALFVQDDKSAFPTVEERPHGEWEACLDTEYCKCSYCGTVVMLEESVRFHFCPNCGADMREGESGSH